MAKRKLRIDSGSGEVRYHDWNPRLREWRSNINKGYLCPECGQYEMERWDPTFDVAVCRACHAVYQMVLVGDTA